MLWVVTTCYLHNPYNIHNRLLISLEKEWRYPPTTPKTDHPPPLPAPFFISLEAYVHFQSIPRLSAPSNWRQFSSLQYKRVRGPAFLIPALPDLLFFPIKSLVNMTWCGDPTSGLSKRAVTCILLFSFYFLFSVWSIFKHWKKKRYYVWNIFSLGIFNFSYIRRWFLGVEMVKEIAFKRQWIESVCNKIVCMTKIPPLPK